MALPEGIVFLANMPMTPIHVAIPIRSMGGQVRFQVRLEALEEVSFVRRIEARGKMPAMRKRKILRIAIIAMSLYRQIAVYAGEEGDVWHIRW